MKQKVNKTLAIYIGIGSVCFFAAVLLTIILGAGIFHPTLSLSDELLEAHDIEERCSNPPDGPFVFWDYRIRTESLVQIQYSCVEGFFFEANEITVSTCLQDGQWSQIFAPQCVPDCGLPPAIPNTKKKSENNVLTKNGSRIVTSASYSCENSILVSRVRSSNGEINIKCLLNNKWEEPEFKCVASSCPTPPRRSRVSWFYVNIRSDDITIDITTSNQIRYKCDNGYYFAAGEVENSNCFNGNWDIEAAPLCLPDCGDVPVITNALTQGKIDTKPAKNRDPIATAAFYSCENEAVFIGPETTLDIRLRCLDNASWEKPNFRCVRECPDPGRLLDVHDKNIIKKISGTKLYSGTVIYYSYKQNLKTIIATDGVTCLDNGLWDKTFVHASIEKVSKRVFGGNSGEQCGSIADGIADGVADQDIAASSWRFQDSEALKEYFKPTNGRLFSNKGEGSWTAADSDREKTLQVDYRSNKIFNAVVTQGSASGSLWPKYVTSFRVMFRKELELNFKYVSYENGQPVLFNGNFDGETPIINEFPTLITASVLKIKIVTWQDLPSLRVDFLSC